MTAICRPSTNAVRIDSSRHRPSDAHRRGPRGQRDPRQREEHVAGHPALAEEDLEGHPDHDDHDAEPEEEGDRTGPGRVGATGRNDEAGHRADEGEQDRVVRPHRADGQAGGPDPPRHRVQGAAHWPRQPGASFFGWPSAPSEDGRRAEGDDDDRHDDDGEQARAARADVPATVLPRAGELTHRPCRDLAPLVVVVVVLLDEVDAATPVWADVVALSSTGRSTRSTPTRSVDGSHCS